MIALPELIVVCEKLHACGDAMRHLRSCKTLEDAARDYRAPEWAYWLLCNDTGFQDDTVEALERVACGGSEWVSADMAIDTRNVSERGRRLATEDVCDRGSPWSAYKLLEKANLSEDLKQKAVRRALESEVVAYHLRVGVPNLSADVKREAELKACESPACAHLLSRYRMDLHPDTVERMVGMGLKPTPESNPA